MITNPESLSLRDLVDAIVNTHHAYLWERMDALRDEADAAVEADGASDPRLGGVRNDVYALTDDLTAHLTKEERILFPQIQILSDQGSCPFGDLTGPIRVMLAEHDSATAIMERIVSATDGLSAPTDADPRRVELFAHLAGVRDDLAEHIRVENEVLFPRTLDALR